MTKIPTEDYWADLILDDIIPAIRVKGNDCNAELDYDGKELKGQLINSLVEFAHDWCKENLDYCRELFERP